MEPSKEPISVRIARLNNLFIGRGGTMPNLLTSRHFLGREGLLDALVVLYDECNNDILKKDRNIASFVDKFRGMVSELRRLRINLADFEFKKVIGRGHFGEVQVVREKQTGDVYAMKTLRKCDTLNQQAFYQEERDIMARAASPWLTMLQYAFQDMHHLYLVMEFHAGGDLLALLDRFGGALPEDTARFYLAELALALRALHTMGYVHRDIKPDNVLIDRLGHLKLADFGSAARLTSAGVVTSMLPVGTPEYIAPEVLQAVDGNKGSYGLECDYWSLGVVAYEMVEGHTPFSGDQLTITYHNIMNHHLEFPDDSSASQTFKRLVASLLDDAAERLKHEQLVKHEFFVSVNWDGLRDAVPPFVPVVNSVDDTSNFVEFEHEAPALSIENFKTRKEFSGRNLPFVGFTYTHDVKSEAATIQEGPDLQTLLDSKKKEVEELHRKLQVSHQSDRNREIEALERKAEDRDQRLEKLESERGQLEAALVRSRGEAQSLRRALDLEREDRKTMESKAVALLRDNRAKWDRTRQQELTQLRQQLQAKDTSALDLSTRNTELNSKLERQKEELRAAQQEVQRLQAQLGTSKGKIAEARKQSRLSVVGIETRLERMASESQVQLVAVQQQLEEETKLRAEAQSQLWEKESAARQKEAEMQAQLERLQSERTQLQNKLDRITQKCLALEASTEERARRMNESDRNRLAQLEEKLKAEKEECEEMRTRLMSLEEDLSESLRSREQAETSQGARLIECEAQLGTLEKELKRATEEHMQMQRRLQEAADRDEDMTAKVTTLEDLFNLLQQSSAHLEAENLKLQEQVAAAGEAQVTACIESAQQQEAEVRTQLAAQKAFLETQVEKLECQLEKMRESSVLERDAAKTVQATLWRKEKELSDAKIDLRIAQREARQAEEQLKTLQEEKQRWAERAQAEKTAHTQEMKDCWAKMEALREEQAALRTELEQRLSELQALKAHLEMEKTSCTETVRELEQCRLQLQSVRRELETSGRATGALERQIATLQGETTRLARQGEEVREDKIRIVGELEEQKARCSGLELHVTMLKEACTMLEEQLEDFETLTATYEGKEKAAAADKLGLQAEVETLQGEVRSARQETNEEKSLRIRAEMRLQQLESELASRTEDAAVMTSQLKDYKSLAETLTQQVTELESDCGNAELSLRTVRRQLEAQVEETAGVKEECTQQLTQIHSLRESNFKLGRELEELTEQCQAQQDRIGEVQAAMEELQVFQKHREIKMEATLQQHTKLIDFLQQSLAEHSKKKKTLTGMLFGGRHKENVAPGLEAQLARERSKVKALSEQLACTQTKRSSSKISGTGSSEEMIRPVTALGTQTPNTRRALTHLVQSPGSLQRGQFERQPSLQRMHHKIPHRFEPRLCMRVSKCAVCLDSVHFGRNAAVCQECEVTAHPKCSLVLPTTCGLHSAFASHCSRTWANSNGQDKTVPRNEGATCMEGYVKLPGPGQKSWERCYLRLHGTTLQTFNAEPSSEDAVPTSTFEVCPAEGVTSVLSAVPDSDVPGTAHSDLPFLLKVEVRPRTTCWPGKALLVMALNFPDKQRWVTALETAVQGQCRAADRYQGTPLLRVEKDALVDFNCSLQLGEKLLLLGAEEGLFSLPLQGKLPDEAAPVHIQGVTHVYQLAVLSQINLAIMIAGENRTLSQCDLRQLRAAAQAAACSVPTVSPHPVLQSSPGVAQPCCHLFAASPGSPAPSHQAKPVLCAATANKLMLLRWVPSQSCFTIVKVLDTSEPCSCIHFSPHSILVGCNKFFEIDLRDLSVEEFLDSSDSTLAHAVFGTQQLNSFPVAILDVASSKSDSEYLLCFNEFGVFVDQYGQRTREDDIKWSHLPLAFAYRKPYLFILHFASVEVMRLTSLSFTRDSDESTATTSTVANYPNQTFVELNNPRYLGVAHDSGAIYVSSSTTPKGVEVLRMEGVQVCREDPSLSLDTDSSSERDGADLNCCTGSEFSFTSSLAQSLDGELDSDSADARRVRFGSVPHTAM